MAGKSKKAPSKKPTEEEESLTQEPDILPPKAESKTGDTFLALIQTYTDRPDLMLKVMEEFEPGFTKRYVARIEEYEKKYSQARFTFGKWQAYLSLVLRFIATLAIVYILYLGVPGGHIGFLPIIGLTVFYAVVQGAAPSFTRIYEALAWLIKRLRGTDK